MLLGFPLVVKLQDFGNKERQQSHPRLIPSSATNLHFLLCSALRPGLFLFCKVGFPLGVKQFCVGTAGQVVAATPCRPHHSQESLQKSVTFLAATAGDTNLQLSQAINLRHLNSVIRYLFIFHTNLYPL